MAELSLLAKATVVIGLALAAVGVARRSRAALRAQVLTWALVALIALPIVTTLIPGRTIDVRVANRSSLLAIVVPSAEAGLVASPGANDRSHSRAWRFPEIA